LPTVRFISATDPKFLSTLTYLEQRLLKKGQYITWEPTDTVANNAATFWYISTLANVGRKEEARKLFENMLRHVNHVGILSETVDLETGELWGNFPHITTMVSLISAAELLSKSWKEAF